MPVPSILFRIRFSWGQGEHNWHALRHTHGALLHELGTPQKVAQAQLGHSHLNTTIEVYTHASTNALRQDIDSSKINCSQDVSKFSTQEEMRED